MRVIREPAKTSGGHSSESGYALAILMLVAALLLIAISVALPDLKTQAKREKELELQFRAMQYVRAIQAYNRKFPNQWPLSVDALMNTNNVRFLRQKWKDPMTKDGEWRFIHLGPNGAVVDSTATFKPGSVESATGTSTAAGSQVAAPTTQSPSGISQTSGAAGGSAVGPLQADASSLSATQLSNLPIVGVASRSTEESIMACGGATHYNEWEYIALPQGRLAGTGCYQGVPVTLLNTTGQPGATQPGAGTQPGTAGTPSQGTPPSGSPPVGNRPSTPFGTPPPN